MLKMMSESTLGISLESSAQSFSSAESLQYSASNYILISPVNGHSATSLFPRNDKWIWSEFIPKPNPKENILFT